MYVRLTAKLANFLDGIDVADFHVGDVIDLSAAEAAVLIAEGWAERVSGDAAVPINRLKSQEQTG